MPRNKKESKYTHPKNLPIIGPLHAYLLKLCQEGQEIPRIYQIAEIFGVNERTVGRNCKTLAKQNKIIYCNGNILAVKVDGNFVEVTQTDFFSTYEPVSKQELYKYLCEKSPNIPKRADIAADLKSNIRALYEPLKKLEHDGLIKFLGDHQKSIVIIKEYSLASKDHISEDASRSKDKHLKDHTATIDSSLEDALLADELLINKDHNDKSRHVPIPAESDDYFVDEEAFQNLHPDAPESEKDKDENQESFLFWDSSIPYYENLLDMGIDDTSARIGEYRAPTALAVNDNVQPVSTDVTQDTLVDSYFAQSSATSNSTQTTITANIPVELLNASNTDNASNGSKDSSTQSKQVSKNKNIFDSTKISNANNSEKMASHTDIITSNVQKSKDLTKLLSDKTYFKDFKDFKEIFDSFNTLDTSIEIATTHCLATISSHIPTPDTTTNNSEESKTASPVANRVSNTLSNNTVSFIVPNVNLASQQQDQIDALHSLASLSRPLLFSQGAMGLIHPIIPIPIKPRSTNHRPDADITATPFNYRPL